MEEGLRPAGLRHPAVSQHDLVHRADRSTCSCPPPNGLNTTATRRPATHFNRHYARCHVTHLGETVNPFVSPYQVAAVCRGEARRGERASTPTPTRFRSSRAPDARASVLGRADGPVRSWHEMLDGHRPPLHRGRPSTSTWCTTSTRSAVSDGLPRGFATISRKVDVYSESHAAPGAHRLPLHVPLRAASLRRLRPRSARSRSRRKAPLRPAGLRSGVPARHHHGPPARTSITAPCATRPSSARSCPPPS